MTFFARRSKRMDARKMNRFLPSFFTFFLIVVISPLSGCAPRVPAEPVTITPEPTATAVESVAFTPTIFPSATEPPPPLVTPTDTQFVPATPLTFPAEADAWVDESEPDENNGSGETLRTDGSSDRRLESYIRFTVTGVSGWVENARLRVYADDNDSEDGPAVYLTEPTWEETAITWNTRPALVSTALDNKEIISARTWVEYNVTSQVTADGTFSFLLAADSGDGVAFSSRHGAYPPELVITLGSGIAPSATPTLPSDAVVLVGAGDIASCGNDNDEMTAQLLDAIPGTVFTTGDNVYGDASYAEFLECYDPTWGRHKERTRPIPGNHDYDTPGAAGYFQYFDNIPSYYAYDLGSWRIYALNSQIGVSLGSEQVIWLLADLAANPRQCVLAYWHAPRWSSGSLHGSDDDYQVLWEIFYRAGAELVVNGHEHSYERFAEMDANGSPSSPGLRQIVAGMGGRSLYQFDAPLPASEVRDNSSYGVLKLTLHADRYEWEFIPAAGSTFTDSGSTPCH